LNKKQKHETPKSLLTLFHIYHKQSQYLPGSLLTKIRNYIIAACFSDCLLCRYSCYGSHFKDLGEIEYSIENSIHRPLSYLYILLCDKPLGPPDTCLPITCMAVTSCSKQVRTFEPESCDRKTKLCSTSAYGWSLE
jgi:hypothetical protein